MRRWLAVPVFILLLASCEDATIVEPELRAGRHGPHSQSIVVMSRNLYLGADIDPLRDPTVDSGRALTTALTQVQNTDFAARAGANAGADEAAPAHARRSRCPTYTPASTSPPPTAMNGPNGSPRSGTASPSVASGSR